ncbi:MAG: baseplate J/gp47 family protein [Anaerolineae bacterium]|nr:baseplate J/gp47 family protein [Thermoflexales bacterium]MDW8394626.1 baseplate J/gp47 family protein [Anaerolineae bacterium]
MSGRIVALDPNEDVAGACDRLRWSEARHVLLVFPSETRWRELDYARLQRTAQALGIVLAVVHPKLHQRLAAREAGLVAFTSVEQATSTRWSSPEHTEPLRRQQPPRRFIPNSLGRFFPRRSRLAQVVRAVIAVAALGIVASAALILAPHARITLVASSQPIQTIVQATLDTRAATVNLAERIIPAQRVDVVVEDRLTVPTTGRKEVPKFKARGLVTFTNFLVTPYTVPKDTVVRTTATGAPIRFITLADVEVPPGGQANVEVEALEEGARGNVPAYQINRVEGVPALAVTVFNLEPLQGGGDVIVRSVTESDYRRLRAALRERLLQLAVEQMRQAPEVVNSGLVVLPETLFIADVQDETYDRFIAEQADQVTLNMRLQVAGLAIDPRDVRALARDALLKKTPQGFSLLSIDQIRSAVVEEGTGSLTQIYITARGKAGAEIDPNTVRELARGKTLAEAQIALLRTFSLRQSPRIELEPSWLTSGRLPLLTLRIEARVLRE